MTLPGFSAERCLYQGSGHYRSAEGSPFYWGESSQVAVPAYEPGRETQAKCNAMAIACRDSSAICFAGAFIFPPAIAGCNTALLGCMAAIPLSSECCPKRCELDVEFALSGGGCCDLGENCVDQHDPNSRNGCCPADQAVCGGKCCPPGQKCCGNSCCPSAVDCCGDACGCTGGMVCLPDNVCGFPSLGPVTPDVPPGVIKIPIPPSGECPQGFSRCEDRTVCCLPGIHCCASGCSASTCIH
jgi:hypothetical protein